MTRKEFFRKLGIGVAAIVVAPKVIAEASKSKDSAKLFLLDDEMGKTHFSNRLKKYPLTYDECFAPSLVINSIWIERKTHDEFLLTSLTPKNRVELIPILLHTRNGSCPGLIGMYHSKKVDSKYFLKAYYPKYDQSERKQIIRDLITFGEAKTRML